MKADWEIPMPANAGHCVTVRKLVVLEAPVCTSIVTLTALLSDVTLGLHATADKARAALSHETNALP